MAEFDYAFPANSTDPNDPYAKYLSYGKFMKVKEKILGIEHLLHCFGPEAGVTMKNNWGLSEFRIWFQPVLDRVDAGMVIGHPKKFRLPFVLAETPKKSGGGMVCLKEDFAPKTDPLFWSEREPTLPLFRTPVGGVFAMGECNSRLVHRIVIGPDLVSEWKAKRAAKK